VRRQVVKRATESWVSYSFSHLTTELDIENLRAFGKSANCIWGDFARKKSSWIVGDMFHCQSNLSRESAGIKEALRFFRGG
jgi:hypothetical protein